jgi:hypothetical protein
VENRHLIVFLPWLSTGDPIRIGPFVFWSFDKQGQARFNDPSIVSHLKKIFSSYVVGASWPEEGYRFVPVADVTVVSEENTDLRKIPNLPHISMARDALTFACIDRAIDQGSFYRCTAETFEIARLDFSPGVLEFQYHTGAIAPTQHLGWRLGEVQFAAPIEADVSYEAKLSSDLIPGLSFAVEGLDDPNCRRIVKSLEFFRLACFNSPDFTPEMRVILMATAFESLLNFEGRKGFRRMIGELCCECSEPKRKYKIEHHRPGSKDDEEELTEKQIWAEEFFKLRNAIVHGDETRVGGTLSTTMSYFRNSTVFFRHCTRKKLEQLNGLRYRSPTTIVQKQDSEFELDIDLLCDTNCKYDE